MEPSNIIQSMKNNLRIEANKIEGGFANDLIGAFAQEQAKYYLFASWLMNQQFVATATDEYLDYLAIDNGLERKEAKKATGTLIAKGSGVLPIGSRFSRGNIHYETTEEKTLTATGVIISAECVIIGEVGNASANTITETDVSNVTEAINEHAFTGGREKETDDQLRARILKKLQAPTTSGNKYDYEKWALSVDGVGRVKVKPLINGAGTVGVYVLSSDLDVPSDEVITSVSEYIEDIKPIGASLIVNKAQTQSIDIEVTVPSGVDSDEIKTSIENIIDAYLKFIAFKDVPYLSYARVGDMIFNSGVSDYSNLKINNGISNINLTDDTHFFKLNSVVVHNG